MTSQTLSTGARFRKACEVEKPLQVVGALNAYSALLAERAGFAALYLSGGGVAYGSFGLPDLGMTTLHDVLEDARRIIGVTELPLLVDIDTGFGPALSIGRTIRELEKAGVAAVQLEDQVAQKRCGHRPGKKLVRPQEMIDRVKTVVDSRRSDDFVLIARTDALAVEGLDGTVDRAQHYIDAGADFIFLEAATELNQYKQVSERITKPVLANMTEFGKTPLFTKKELADAGVGIILYPLSAFRAMSKAAEQVYGAIRSEGDQKSVIPLMQTRQELYEVLDYHKYEDFIDKLFEQQQSDDD